MWRLAFPQRGRRADLSLNVCDTAAAEEVEPGHITGRPECMLAVVLAEIMTSITSPHLRPSVRTFRDADSRPLIQCG